MRKWTSFRVAIVSSFIGLSLLGFSLRAHAALSPLSLSLIPPVELPPSSFGVSGVRLSVLWGHHRDMYGVDIGGFGNITDERFVGSSVAGLFNITHGYTDVVGVQFAGATNYTTDKTTVVGVQAALGMNIMKAESSIYGFDIAGIANYVPHTKVHGVQVALFNDSEAVYGLQIGLFNETTDLHGLQIGLLNFNAHGMFQVSPFLNVGF